MKHMWCSTCTKLKYVHPSGVMSLWKTREQSNVSREVFTVHNTGKIASTTNVNCIFSDVYGSVGVVLV